MCGIIGVIGRPTCAEELVTGLTILENRGYDSAGIATLHAGELVVSKCASTNVSDSLATLKTLVPKHKNHTVGIAHTRWATHGGKTDANAHPHIDAFNRVAVVHNGVIENYHELKAELIKDGIAFTSETDTEVIAQLIGRFLDQGHTPFEAVKEAVTKLQGTWGLAVITKDLPDAIIVARNGSPLVIGLAEDAAYVASEPAAFSFATREFLTLENGEIAVVNRSGWGLDRTRLKESEHEVIATSPDPHPHWTIKEILEQPDAIERTLNFGARIPTETTVKLGGLESRTEELLGIDHLIIAACGTSFHAGLYGAMAMRALESFVTVQVVDASELTVHHFAKKGAGLLAISQSGETKDVHRAVELAQLHNVPTFSVVNAVGSLIARATQCGVYCNAGREHAVASTKAFVTQVTALEMIAAWFAEKRGVASGRRRTVINDLRGLSHKFKLATESRTDILKLVPDFKEVEHLFVLGKGQNEAIAKEGALKIKEITYIHAEGYAGGALKHGPFALITEGTPVILIITNDAHAQLMRSAAHEVRARGAKTLIITDHAPLADGVSDWVITIPPCGVLTGLVATVPLQILAYELAVARGINPDKPRNLAKSVTVD
jgi:glucosamine--fructose-6-phosphate aminotransferase (isomerizing)